MARVSVVVPVHGVAEFLPSCLDSILVGAIPDLEVIAVDDASPDGAGRILADRAAADPRLRVISLDRNCGQGHARNVGLDAAVGEYVWFVDGDDQLADGALEAVDRVLSASKPDVALVDWQFWQGRPGRPKRCPGRAEAGPGRGERSSSRAEPSTRGAEPNPGRALLRQVPPGGCTLAEQPKLINLTMTAWSKVYRRSLLRDLGVRFAAGIHEDIPVTCAALLSASVIAAVDRVCYHYRRRPGSAMATTGRQHLAVFEAYRQVFEMLARRDADGQPVSEAVRAAVFERAIWHYSTVLETTRPGVGRFGLPGLVPRADRREFFRRMHEDFVRYRPAGYRHPAGPRGAKLRLVERDAYLTYSMLEPLNQARVAIRRVRSRLTAAARYAPDRSPRQCDRR